MKIYLAGKITNYEHYFIDFWNAEAYFKAKYDCIVLNPAKTVARIDGLEHSEYLHICKAMIDVCDAVAFLSNWKESKGAKIEMEYAKSKGKKIIYMEE